MIKSPPQGLVTPSQFDRLANKSLFKNAENGGYSWWTYPSVTRYNDGEFDDVLYYSYVNNLKETVVKRLNLINGDVQRFAVLEDTVYDEHNISAIIRTDEKKILTAYTAHNADNFLRLRLSASKNNIDFGEEIQLVSSGTVTYAQLIKTFSKIYVFYRVNLVSWAVRISTDNGATWTAEVIIFTASTQHYMRCVLHNDDIRFLIVGHPVLSSDNVIRYGKITTATGSISNLTTPLGNTDGTGLPLTNYNFTILHQPSVKCRLFDYCFQPDLLQGSCFAYADFSSINDASCYVKKSLGGGDYATSKVFDLGLPLESDAGSTMYFCGAWFEYGNDKVLYGAREEAGIYYVEKYETTDYTSWTKTETLAISNTYKLNRPVSPFSGGGRPIWNKAKTYVTYQNYYSQVTNT